MSNIKYKYIKLFIIFIYKMNIQVAIKSLENWGDAGNGRITIKNLGTALSNWSLQLQTVNFTILTMWNLVKEGLGSTITIKPPSWKLSLATNESAESEFSYTGDINFILTSLTPGVTIIGSTSTTPTPKFQILIGSTTHWYGDRGSGFISIKNMGDTISNWSFQLQTHNFNIEQFWNLSKEGSDNIITVKPATWKPTIKTNETIISEFSYIGSPNFSVISLTKDV